MKQNTLHQHSIEYHWCNNASFQLDCIQRLQNLNLYVVIYHRNHLGIMSANAVTTTGGVYTYDFSSGVNQVYGSSLGHKEIESGVWGMISSDGDGSGLINAADETNCYLIDLTASGYRGGDFDLNSLCNAADETNQYLPNLTKGGQIPSGKSANPGYQSQVPQ